MTRIFRVNREQVRRRLGDWARSLASRADVLRVVLFGSFARGDATAASDADLLIILRDSPLPFHERIPQFHPTGIGVSVDVFPYTLEETQRSLEEGWGVAPPAVAEGETLYAAPDAPPLTQVPQPTDIQP